MNIFIWLILLIIFALIETFTLTLIALWFSVGALFAMFASLFTNSYVVQILVFIVTTSIAMLFIKPLARKHLKNTHIATNIDRFIGQTAIVTKDITETSGEVSVLGQIWSAQNISSFKPISKGEKVEILEIKGVKLIVKTLN